MAIIIFMTVYFNTQKLIVVYNVIRAAIVVGLPSLDEEPVFTEQGDDEEYQAHDCHGHQLLVD